MLAKNSRAPRDIWFYALSFTTIATIRHASSYRAKALRI